MIDGIQAVYCDPAKAHTEANTLTQSCSGVHKLGSEQVRSAISVQSETFLYGFLQEFFLY